MSKKKGADAPSEEGMTEEESHPRGTLFLMLLFLISIAAMWSYMYLILLERA